MTFEEIKQAGEKMTYENAVRYIQMLPLELSLIRDMKCERLWRVENSKEVNYISVCYKSLVTGMAQIGIIPKN